MILPQSTRTKSSWKIGPVRGAWMTGVPSSGCNSISSYGSHILVWKMFCFVFGGTGGSRLIQIWIIPQFFFSKIMQFSGNFFGENPLFWANFRLRAPLGVKILLGPPDQNPGSAWGVSWIGHRVPSMVLIDTSSTPDKTILSFLVLQHWQNQSWKTSPHVFFLDIREVCWFSMRDNECKRLHQEAPPSAAPPKNWLWFTSGTPSIIRPPTKKRGERVGKNFSFKTKALCQRRGRACIASWPHE